MSSKRHASSKRKAGTLEAVTALLDMSVPCGTDGPSNGVFSVVPCSAEVFVFSALRRFGATMISGTLNLDTT
eukprot:CAMPEP_0194525550 /NCGR_PEP_ID=MMETSP0253-20130528/61074_1 /TAXON_ID=2966 /ORGANISM="Noctiluca scintillans" /LENGTH=71 /DNA_ID=CAMNT_0039370297 /DNA_START=141 /DNA_END=352 /DNA_ORIENTATION=+